MKVLIAYGTIEGHTGKIAAFVASLVRDLGHEVFLVDTKAYSGEIEYGKVDKIILAASVHERRHPKAFEDFLYAHRTELKQREVLLLSVSLNAAFEESRDAAQDYVDEMNLRTGLDPDVTLLVAGAVRPESYDDYAARVLSRVILRGKSFDPTKDAHEFTDWDALKASVTEFLA